MYDNSQAYFIENIIIPFKQYLKDKKNKKSGFSSHLRSTINIASNLYHLREHIPNNSDLSRKKLEEICSDYALLGDVVNASKHKILTNNNPQLSNSENIFEILIATEYKDKEGKYIDTGKSVYIKLDSGQERDLHEIIINVMNMWLVKLEELKLIEHIKSFPYHSTRLPKRNKNSRKMDFSAMQNLRFNPRFKIQKYNYETKSVEPMDLTGATIVGRIYEPKFIMEMKISLKNGKEHNLEISLNQTQKNRLDKIKGEIERHQFILKLAVEQNLINIEKNN
ncbi:hypothetical protein [Gramella sp. MAR_2010_147]|uniref:hypothetical protein n=1 Tax=Gramella sp. MAR_2010_147 TaxID=1250205 RepID=UPI00087D679F|nr:hypothetical protein [Gramella sp. MAR_2010_147]SDR91828.1 hypothetical protein SAMN04488553_1027 [Gramella sp. MAR_2010_147]